MTDVSLEGWPLLLTVVSIMFVMGLFGGFVNFLLSAKGDPERSRLKSVSAGVAASFLIPLFLKTIGSNLLTSKIAAPDLLVLAGFSLIAAVSSRAFMKSLAETLLQKAREVTEEVRKDADRVEGLVVEPESPAGEVTTASDRPSATISETSPLEPKAVVVLRALIDSRFVMRTLSGIAMDTRLSATEVSTFLAELEKRGLAQVVLSIARRLRRPLPCEPKRRSACR